MDNSFGVEKANQNGFDWMFMFFFALGNFGIFVSGSKLLQLLYSLSVLLLPKQSINDYFSAFWSLFPHFDQLLSCWMTKSDTLCNSFPTIVKVLNDSLFPLHKLPIYCIFNKNVIYRE
jgi:hypothetical protein